MSDRQSRVSVSKAIRTCKSAFVGIFLVSAVLNLLMLTGPIFMLQVYDRVMASNSVPTLAVLSAIAISLYLFSGALDVLRARALTRISMRVYTRLSNPALRANIRLPILAGHKAAGVQPIRDLDAVRRFLASAGPAAIFDLPFMPFYFLLVFLFHTWLGWLAVAGGVIILALVLVNEITSRAPTRELGARSGVQTRIIESARRNAEVVGAMGMLGRISERSADLLDPYCAAQQAASDRSTLFSSMIKMLRLLLQSAMLGLGAYLAIHQEISPGVMIAASIIMARALAPIEQAVSHWPSFIAARQGSARLNQALEQCGAETGTPRLPLPSEDLRIEDLATGAPGEPVVVLQGVELTLRAGDGLGVVGPSGSGKTSLARAIVGVWPALKGSIRFDGATVDQWTEADRGRLIGYLPQDVELFDGTISENISRFAADPQVVDIVSAAKLAGIHRLVAALPDGYNTRVGDGGARLSAGQRQRIGLARALFGAPFLLVLDEPNSNLDLEGEQALTHAMLETRRRGGIVVVVAHRTSALAAVNKVLRIQNGQQAMFGDRDEVLSIPTATQFADTRKAMSHAV